MKTPMTCTALTCTALTCTAMISALFAAGCNIPNDLSRDSATEPSQIPIASPTVTPSPTETADPVPSATPTTIPTVEPTPIPTLEPTPIPTLDPAPIPTVTETPAPVPGVTYKKDIAPILKKSCVKCHDEIADYAGAYQNREAIYLTSVVELTMPKKKPLSEENRGLITQWFNFGAPEGN